MCNCYEDPEDAVDGFPPHADEAEESEFKARDSQPEDFLDISEGSN